jgi:hypothetical protein
MRGCGGEKASDRVVESKVVVYRERKEARQRWLFVDSEVKESASWVSLPLWEVS